MVAASEISPSVDAKTQKLAYSQLVNDSGKLRMLSQRALMYLNIYACAEDEGRRSHARQELGTVIQTFKDTFTRLIHGDHKAGIPPLFSASAEVVLQEAPHNAYQKVRDWQSNLDRLQRSNRDTVSQHELDELTRYTAGTLLDTLNALTQAFADDQKALLDQEADAVNSVLDEIARITNQVRMISLNATIEAARAGEAGKAFEVVAREIRALSARSQAASDEIRDLLGV